MHLNAKVSKVFRVTTIPKFGLRWEECQTFYSTHFMWNLFFSGQNKFHLESWWSNHSKDGKLSKLKTSDGGLLDFVHRAYGTQAVWLTQRWPKPHFPPLWLWSIHYVSMINVSMMHIFMMYVSMMHIFMMYVSVKLSQICLCHNLRICA